MPRKIWQPTHPTRGWIQAQTESELTIYIPHPYGDVPIFFRRIPAGEFHMGSRSRESPSEEPVHRVVIPQDFYLGTFPVTKAQYRAIVEASNPNPNPNPGPNPGLGQFEDDLCPVETLSWYSVMARCRELSATEFFEEALGKSGLALGEWQAGLPSEAHWEYACRSGTETDYWSGDGEAALAEVACYGEEWNT